MDGIESMLTGKGSPEKWSPQKGPMHAGTALKNEQLRDHDENPIRVEEKVAWMSNKGQQQESDQPDDSSTVRGSFSGMPLPPICCSLQRCTCDLNNLVSLLTWRSYLLLISCELPHHPMTLKVTLPGFSSKQLFRTYVSYTLVHLHRLNQGGFLHQRHLSYINRGFHGMLLRSETRSKRCRERIWCSSLPHR
jgi:hypothetical protein